MILGAKLLVASGCIAVTACAFGQGGGPEARYYRMTELSFGSLHFRNLHVASVAIPSSTSGDQVHELIADRGSLSIDNADGPERLRCSIAEGTLSDPAFILEGNFTWKHGRISAFTLNRFHVRLSRPSGAFNLYGGSLEFDKDQTIFLDSITPINFDDNKVEGSFTLTGSKARIASLGMDIGGIRFSTDLASSRNQLTLLLDGNAASRPKFKSAVFHAENVRAGNLPDNNPFSKEQILDAEIVFDDLTLSFDKTVRIKTSQAHVDHPKVKIPGYDLSVAASKSYLIREMAAEVPSESDSLLFEHPQVGSTRITVDQWQRVNAINSVSRLTPEVLLPTGSPDIRFIKASDLFKIEETMAESTSGPDRLTRIAIKSDKGVVTQVESDFVPISIQQEGQPTHPICVFIQALTGEVVNVAVLSLVAEPAAVGTAAWLAYATAFTPRIEGAVFMTAFAITKVGRNIAGGGDSILYKTGLLGPLGGLAGYFAGEGANSLCEMFIANYPFNTVSSRSIPIVVDSQLSENATEANLNADIVESYKKLLGEALRIQPIRDRRLIEVSQGQSSRTLSILQGAPRTRMDAYMQKQSEQRTSEYAASVQKSEQYRQEIVSHMHKESQQAVGGATARTAGNPKTNNGPAPPSAATSPEPDKKPKGSITVEAPGETPDEPTSPR